MKLFLAVCEDHHTDAVIRPFTRLEDAKAFVHAFEALYDHKPDYEQEDGPEPWLYLAQWGEGETTHIEPCELDNSELPDFGD